MNDHLLSVSRPDFFSYCANVNDFYDKFSDLLDFLIDKYVHMYPSNDQNLDLDIPRIFEFFNLESLYGKKCRIDTSLKERYRAINKAILKMQS